MLAGILNRIHNLLGVWGLGLFLFLISKSLSTGCNECFSLGPKSRSSWIFEGPGRPREASRRPREASGGLLELPGASWALQNPGQPRFWALGQHPQLTCR